MAQELSVVLNRRDSNGFGFSVLGKPGFPPVIYDIIENSPAAESGKVEAGDVILQVNETDVIRFNTKEVLKCLRLSKDPVSLKLKRDPEIKERVFGFLSSTVDRENSNPSSLEGYHDGTVNGGGNNNGGKFGRSSAATAKSYELRKSKSRDSVPSSGPFIFPLQGIMANNGTDFRASGDDASQSSEGGGPIQPPKFEAFMMTGDRLLKLTKNQQMSLLPKHEKKIDSLKQRYHLKEMNMNSNNSNSNVSSGVGSGNSSGNGNGTIHGSSHHHHHHHRVAVNGSNNGNQNHGCYKSVPSSPVEAESPDDEMKSSSTGTSPIPLHRPSPSEECNTASSFAGGGGSTSENRDSPYEMHTCRSDDHMQFKKGGASVSTSSVQFDDEDITSSLNTLLDTRERVGFSEQQHQRRSKMFNDRRPTTGGTAARLEAAAAAGRNVEEEEQYDDDEDEDEDSNTKIRRTEDQRILWTYNAPHAALENNNSTNTSEENLSSSHPSPRSVTSVSSSVMSSRSSSADNRKRPQQPPTASSQTNSFDLSHLEGLSSPDYNEEYVDMVNSHEMNMEVTDPSDSDSTILVSEPKIRRVVNRTVATSTVASSGVGSSDLNPKHRIVIQVKGAQKESSKLYTGGYGSYNSSNISSTGSSSSNNGGTVSVGHNHTVGNGDKFRRLKLEQDGYYNQDDPKRAGYEALSEYDDELFALTEGAVNLAKSVSPPHTGSSEDESSDVESLHSFHYSPKAVDYPSAHRLAKRLYLLDGFRKSDVSRHLSKNNDFNRAVAEEYLRHFDFTNDSLDGALRKFLKQFNLTGETQERERVLIHFSKRYLDCNTNSFNSQDAVHTLTCAIMLLNTDLHGQITGRKMTCSAFIDNLAGLNDGDDFPKDILKSLYHSIKSSPLEWATDDETEDADNLNGSTDDRLHPSYDDRNAYSSSFTEHPSKKEFRSHEQPTGRTVIDYKKGYVMRKCCIDPNGKRTPLGKRGWKMYYCTLRDLVLYLHKDEHGFRKNQFSDNANNAIRLHHALATKAADYTKKLHVFRLETADRAEYLFQTSDSKELQSWVDTINLVCASFSAPALSEPVGSQKKFQRPLLPSAPSKLNLREQLKEHERTVDRLEEELEHHRTFVPERNCKTLVIHNHKERDTYLCYELKRYKTYVYLLESRLPQLQDTKSISPVPLADIDSEEENAAADEDNEDVSQQQQQQTVNNRLSQIPEKIS